MVATFSGLPIFNASQRVPFPFMPNKSFPDMSFTDGPNATLFAVSLPHCPRLRFLSMDDVCLYVPGTLARGQLHKLS